MAHDHSTPRSAPHSPHTMRIHNPESEQVRVLEEELLNARETIRTKNEEIAALHERNNSLHHEIEALQARVHRQEVTIRNQSRTIQDPRSLRSRRYVMPETTPAPPPGLPPVQSQQPYYMSFNNYPNYQESSSFMGQQAFRGSVNLHNPPQLQQQQGQMPMVAPMYHQTTRRAPWSPQNLSQHGSFRFPPPGSGRPALDGSNAGERLQGLFMPMAQLREPSIQTVNAQRPLHEAITNTEEQAMIAASSKKDPSYAGIEFEKNAANIAGHFRSLWIKADQFAKSYAHGEDVTLLPDQLPYRLKEYMMVHNSPEMAIRFLNSPGNKQRYVAKVVNFYLCKKILKYTEVVRGCDPLIDIEISSHKKKITHGTEVSPTTKHYYLSAISKCVIRATERPDFKDFCYRYREEHTEVLQKLLEPLLSLGETSPALQKSLGEIVRDAHNLALELYCLPYDARCHFPEIEEAYDPTIMMNMDTEFDLALINNAKVKMSVTPVIRLGQNEFQPVRVRNVSMAKVFTGLPGSKEGHGISSGRTPGRGAKR